MKRSAAGTHVKRRSSNSRPIVTKSIKRTAKETEQRMAILKEIDARSNRKNTCLNTSNIPPLPEGPVANILSFLALNEAARCTSVSKIWWNMISCTDRVTMVIPRFDIIADHDNNILVEEKVKKYTRRMLGYTASRFQHVKLVSIDVQFEDGNTYPIEDTVLAEFLSHFPDLICFSYNGTNELSERRRGWDITVGFRPVCKMSNLERLVIKGAPIQTIQDDSVFGISCVENLINLLRNKERLKVLKLTQLFAFMINPGNGILVSRCLGRLYNLEELVIIPVFSNFWSEVDADLMFAGLVRLRTLDVYEPMDETLLGVARHCSSLDILKISLRKIAPLPNFGLNIVDIDTIIAVLQNCPIRVLHFYNWNREVLDVSVLRRICEVSDTLVELNIGVDKRIDYGDVAIVQQEVDVASNGRVRLFFARRREL